MHAHSLSLSHTHSHTLTRCSCALARTLKREWTMKTTFVADVCIFYICLSRIVRACTCVCVREGERESIRTNINVFNFSSEYGSFCKYVVVVVVVGWCRRCRRRRRGRRVRLESCKSILCFRVTKLKISIFSSILITDNGSKNFRRFLSKRLKNVNCHLTKKLLPVR